MKRFLMKVCVYFFVLTSSLLVAQAPNTPPSEEPAPTVSTAPTKPESTQITSSYQTAFVKMMITLVALIILIVLSVWMLRRISHGRFKQLNYNRAIKVLERRPLSAKSVLYLIQVGEKKILISESQLEVRSLTSVDEISSSEAP